MNSPEAIAVLLAMMATMIAASIWKKHRRPTNDELMKLGKGFVGSATSLFVIVWTLKHLTVLEGNGPIIVIGMVPFAWGSLCAGYDAVKEMLAKEVPALPPVPSKRGRKKRKKSLVRVTDSSGSRVGPVDGCRPRTSTRPP
jgi:hypothetical protein